MATYAVGDVQGCYDPLRRVLDQAGFSPDRDRLWGVGDFVNRGPDSLAVLRFLRDLGDSFRGVLGNHDLHLLARVAGVSAPKSKDTLDALLHAPDLSELVDWLRALPVAHYEDGYLMVHAGVVPSWDLAAVLERAGELEAALRGPEAAQYYEVMYGDAPELLEEASDRWRRLRVITNVFTRLRFCGPDDRLDLRCKRPPDDPPAGMRPWFEHPHRRTRDVPIVFGHWAAMGGKLDDRKLIGLDTACVWGQRLSLMRLADRALYQCDCA